MLIGWYISFSLVNRLLQAALIEKTYRWQSYEPNEDQYYDTKIAGMVSSDDNSKENNKDSPLESQVEATVIPP